MDKIYKQRKYNKRYCIAYGCLNSNKNIPDLSLFALPRDPERRREWLIIIGREDLLNKKNLCHRSYEVCCAHFEESAIKVIKLLRANAVPTRHLCPNQTQSSPSTTSKEPTPNNVDSLNDSKIRILSNIRIKQAENTTIATQTETHIVSSEETTQTTQKISEKTPRKRKLLRSLKESESKRRRLENEFNKIKKELEANNAPITSDTEDDINKRFQKLIDWQNKLRNKFKGNRYDAEYKVFALNLHYSSPQTYRCLQTVLKLPSKSTLNKFKIKIPPKLNDRVLEGLSMKIKSLPDKAKYCTICVDEMMLKRNLYYDIKTDEMIGFHNINGKISPEIASNAYVIMLQGIYFKWKQPIAYAFLASTKQYKELDAWMNEVIGKLLGLGVEVKAIISDQGSNFDKYAKEEKKVTIENPYFFVDGRKIYYIFDVPHLVKCVRNNLLSSNFYLNGNRISWEYLEKLYEDQKEKNLRLIPKITDAHIQPNSFQKMRVKYAAQIFSRTMNAALETYIDFGEISEDARPTANFIKTMDNLFDVLNSSKVKSVKKFQTAFTMSQDQTSILKEAQNMFAIIKSFNCRTGKDNTNQIKTFQNFQISIQSILQLFEDLKKEGFQYLFTRRLNQDSLENFFGSVRQQSGSSTEPTPVQFTRAFSKLFTINILKNSPSANCESDIYEVLLKAEDLMRTKITIPGEEFQTSLVLLQGETDYRMDLPEINALTYVAGYLIFKCTKKHNCVEMQRKLKSVAYLNQRALFTHYKAYNKSASFYGGLQMPPKELIQYIDKLETTFTHNFDKCVRNRPGSTIFELLKKIDPVKLCYCFPMDYFLKLFVRLRIFATLKFNNRCFKSGKKSIKQYLKVKQL